MGLKLGLLLCGRNVSYLCLRTECSVNVLSKDEVRLSDQFMMLHNGRRHDRTGHLALLE
jgi:hypothetical protein